MSDSEYKGGFGHKQAKTPAKKPKPITTYEELAKYVKSVNPYKGVAGVVDEVAGSLYPKIAVGGAIAPKAVADYFENNIPYSVQMSSAYIQEMVKQYRAEQGLKPAKASDEAVAYIRTKLRERFLPPKNEVTVLGVADLAKVVDKKTGQVKGYANAIKNGRLAVTGYSMTEYIGGKIKYLYEDSQKYNRASQFRRENVIQILEKHGIEPKDEVVNYIMTEFERQVMDELRSANITADRTKPPKAFIWGIEDYSGRMAVAAVQMQQKIKKGLITTADSDFLRCIGDNVTFGDVERSFSEYITEKGEKAEYLLNTLRDSLRKALYGGTTERMFPLILMAIQEGVKTKTGDEIAKAIEGVYAERLAPAFYIYLPERLSGWVYKVLPRLWVPDGIVSTIYSACFNETPEDYIENIKNNHAKRKKNPNRASWVLP